MVTQFKGAGFTNVSTKEIDDLILGWLTEDGQVKEVSIGGKTSFSTSDSFAADAPVVVGYHIFLKEEKDATESTLTRYLVGGPGWSGAGPAAVGMMSCPCLLMIRGRKSPAAAGRW